MNVSTEADRQFRQHLTSSLRGGNAFEPVEKIFDEIPKDRRFEVPPGLERSAWQVVDHMRRTLEDLLAYSENWNGDYKELDWPKDYWPPEQGNPDDWDKSVAGFAEARKKLERLVDDPSRELTAPFPWSKDHTLLREVLLAIEHTSYHSGQLVEIARVLNT